MSGRRPIERLVAKNKKTGEFVDIGAVWPCHFEGNDYPRNVSFSDNRTSIERVIEIIQSGDYYIDVRPNTAKRAGGSDDGEDWG